MATLTPRRLETIRPIVDRYRQQLIDRGAYDAGELEQELKAALDLGYQEIKDIAEGLLKHDQYVEVGAWYMEHSNRGGGVVSEFKAPLAKLYGIASYDHAKDREERRAEFWRKSLERLRSIEE